MLLAVILPLVVACSGQREAERHRLPEMVGIVVRMDGGAPLSLLVDLHAPRRRPTLRIATGLVVFDGERLVELEELLDQDSGEPRLRVVEQLGDRELEVQLSPTRASRVEVLQILDHHVVTRVDHEDGPAWLETRLDTGTSTEAEEPAPTNRYTRFGPSQGFVVQLSGTDLLFGLPDGEQEPIRLMEGVSRVLAVHWIVAQEDGELERLDSLFKMAGSMVALALPATADGDLGEWRQDQAMAVGSLAQVYSGAGSWHGPRDASMSIAVRVAGSLCGAVRIRDDFILPGEDQVVITVDGDTYRLAVPEEPTVIQQDGLHVAFTDRVHFGVGMEFCVERDRWNPRGTTLPFRVAYHDHDPHEEVTVLATAPEVPWTCLAGLKLPRALVEAVE